MDEPRDSYIERRFRVIERQQERHNEEISALRVIQAEQQALMRALSDQRVDDRFQAREDRQVLISLQAQANRWKGILMAAVVTTTLLGPLVNQAVRYVLFGHPPTEGRQGLIKE